MSKRCDLAFTDAVKRAQGARNSREGISKATERKDWPQEIDEWLSEFVSERDSLYLGTATESGQPYVQHRGGPVGFLKVLDSRRLAFADYAGNRQYISVGNLSENDRAFLFLMDYEKKRRVKIWGRAEFVEDNAELLQQVRSDTYTADAQRVLLFHVEAWDRNCSQHIPSLGHRPLSVERFVGLTVVDERGYEQYREHMKPILARHGGRFGIDLQVSQSLPAEMKMSCTRFFSLRFPSESALEAFFADSQYREVRNRYFDSSVSAVVDMGRYSQL